MCLCVCRIRCITILSIRYHSLPKTCPIRGRSVIYSVRRILGIGSSALRRTRLLVRYVYMGFVHMCVRAHLSFYMSLCVHIFVTVVSLLHPYVYMFHPVLLCDDGLSLLHASVSLFFYHSLSLSCFCFVALPVCGSVDGCMDSVKAAVSDLL